MKVGIISVFIVLILAAHVYAAGIDEALTTAVMDAQKVTVTSQYAIVSDGAQDLAVVIPEDVINVSADMDDKARTCKIDNATAYCGSTKGGKHVFTLTYSTNASLASLDNRVVFKFEEVMPFKTTEHTFILKLPIGSVIPNDPNKDPDFFLNPKPSDVLSDGRRIIVTWKSANVKSVSVSAVTEPVNQTSSWTFLIIIIAIGALSGTGATVYVLRKKIFRERPKHKKGKKKKQAKEPPKVETAAPAVEIKEAKTEVKPLLPQFIEDEQKVVELITKAPNQEIWQKQILIETKFSKAKLSRIIRNLEQRGVVVKTIYGNTNKISLKK